MTRLKAWWRAKLLHILEVNARSAAATYQMAKARYENALLLAESNEDEE
ncbi:hypothetical protein [Mesorhizobium sp.]|nr:hypothetical protein [Mesorhizobium sp.]